MFSGKIEDYILFEDKEIIVCRKPAGIAVQNARIGAMDLESSLKNYLAMQDGGGRRIPYLAVIHRLDQPMRFSVRLWMQFPERKNGCFEFIWIQAVITRSGFRWLMQECLWLVTGNMVPERM